jgi:ABC-2 type transport system ATP-binding protein
MHDETVLKVKEFRKLYGDFVAVDGINFETQRGEIFGLLGPNGAGKTTTLECLEGLRQPSEGSLEILGLDPTREGHKLNNLVGVQLQSSGLPESMTVSEAMKFMCAYHGVPQRMDLLQRLGLGNHLKAQYSELSTGLQRRLALALSVAHKPEILILDEPTAGLDVESRTELHTMMQELKEGGTSILLATHDMAEAEKMTDRVAILVRGRIAATGTPHELTSTGSSYTKVSVRAERPELFDSNKVFPAVSQHLQKDVYEVYYSTDPVQTVSTILAYFRDSDNNLIDLRVERPSLEERFLEITNEGGEQ